MLQTTFDNAVRDTLAAEMRTHSRVIYFASRDNDGGLGVFLQQQFGADRVRIPAGGASPGASALLGAAAGAAQMGYPAVVSVGADDLPQMNLASIAPGAAAPVVVRVSSSGLLSNGWKAPSAEWIVAAPSTPGDAAGLIRGLLRQSRPSVFYDVAELQQTRGDVVLKSALTPGSAVLRREGKDLSIATGGPLTPAIVATVAALAKSERIDVEVLDLRTLWPVDTTAVLATLRKTGRLLLCIQGADPCGSAAAMLQAVHAQGFDDLDAPVRTVQCDGDGWKEKLAQAVIALARE